MRLGLATRPAIPLLTSFLFSFARYFLLCQSFQRLSVNLDRGFDSSCLEEFGYRSSNDRISTDTDLLGVFLDRYVQLRWKDQVEVDRQFTLPDDPHCSFTSFSSFLFVSEFLLPAFAGNPIALAPQRFQTLFYRTQAAAQL